MDDKLFFLINRLSGRSWHLDKLMIFFSSKIRYVFLIILVILLVRKKKVTIEAVVSIFLNILMHVLIKAFYYKPRPFKVRRAVVLSRSKMDSTFPSKHTLLAIAASTTVMFYYRFLGFIMLGLSFLTGLSRIWVGHHYPSDILGSTILGSFTSTVVHKLFKRNGKRFT